MVSLEDLHAVRDVISKRWLWPRGRRLRGVSYRQRRLSDAVSLARRAVHAVGPGLKIAGGKVTSTRCVQVRVLRKLPTSALPTVERLPESMDGVPLDVCEAPLAMMRVTQARRSSAVARARSALESLAATGADTGHYTPLVGGVSAAHQDVIAGTLGYFCRLADGPDDAVYLLSNNHVFADGIAGNPVTAVFQPSPGDNSAAWPAVADLAKAMALRRTTANRVDCALARIRAGVSIDPRIMDIGPIRGTAVVGQGAPVRMRGRSSGLVHGVVSHTGWNVEVGLVVGRTFETYNFANQIQIVAASPSTRFGTDGDSGALVVGEYSQEAVGLFFASETDGTGYANPIQEVLESLVAVLL
jgi:hypothetical protein